MLASSRPYGPVIRLGSPVKLRGVAILQPPAEWPYWAQFWRDWDWATIARTIDALARLQVNCLQVTATGLDDGGVTHPDVPTMRSRIGQLAAYAAGKQMVLNPQLGYQPSHSFGGGVSLGIAGAVTMAKLFAEQANVTFVDAMNEVNYYAAPGWSGPAAAYGDMQGFVAAIRPVLGAIPVTVSVGCSSLADITGSWMQTFAPLCDFHNVHTYYFQNSGTAAPASSDFAGLRAAPWYLGRFAVGETGMPNSDTAQQQTAWLGGNGVVAAAADCLGSVLWGATDTSAAPGRSENVGGFGLMDATGTTVRAALAAPLQGWPGGL